jgi:hypothetical protein
MCLATSFGTTWQQARRHLSIYMRNRSCCGLIVWQ